MSYWTRTIILQQPDAKVVTMIMRIIMVAIILTMITNMTMISGARAVRDEVHKDYEVASEDEQLQLLPRHPLRTGLSANQATW